jgi:hypothetical protein
MFLKSIAKVKFTFNFGQHASQQQKGENGVIKRSFILNHWLRKWEQFEIFHVVHFNEQ